MNVLEYIRSGGSAPRTEKAYRVLLNLPLHEWVGRDELLATLSEETDLLDKTAEKFLRYAVTTLPPLLAQKGGKGSLQYARVGES